jgi:CHAT domain-containing protein/tetratricopeptide (TPR) repeat protein
MTRLISLFLVLTSLMASSPSLATLQEEKIKAATSLLENIKEASKKDGWESLAVAKLLVQLGAIFFELGRFPEAESAFQDSLVTRQKLLPPEHRDIVESLGALGVANLNMGRYQQAEELLNRGLAMAEKILDPMDEHIADIQSNLCVIYQVENHLAAAELSCKKSIKINLKIRGANDYHVGVALNALGSIYQSLGRYQDAEAIFKRTLIFREKNQGAEHPAVAKILSNLAGLYQSQGRNQEAESLLKRALLIQEKALGSEHPDSVILRLNLGGLNLAMGREAEAEQWFRKGIALCESQSYESSPICAMVYANIGAIYIGRGRYSDGEGLLARGLAVSERSLGADNSLTLELASTLSFIYQQQGRQEEAKVLKRRVLDAQSNTIGAKDPRYAELLSTKADEKRQEGKCSEAIPFLEEALALNEKILGRENDRVAANLSALANCYFETERFEKDEQALKRIIKIYESMKENQNLGSVNAHSRLATLYLRQGKLLDAFEHSRQASAILRKRILAAQANDPEANGGSSLEEFSSHFALLAGLAANTPGGLNSELINESFDLAQVARLNTTAEAVVQMTARLASGNDRVANIIRQRQDIAGRKRALDAALIKVLSAPSEKPNIEQEHSLRSELEKSSASIENLDKQIDRDFPAFRELTRPQPLSVKDAQKFLRPDEALVAYVVYKSRSYVWLVRRDAVRFVPIARSAESLNDSVQLIRQSLDLSNVMRADQIRPFDIKESADLYQALWKPISADLAGVRHVLLVVDGPLQSLPFGVLLESLPKDSVETFSEYRSLPWLAKHYAFSTLPAVGSLRALRLTTAPRSKAKRPFIGFGDPLLYGQTPGNRVVSVAEMYSRGSIANVDTLRKLPRITDTANELIAQSRLFHAGADSLYLRERDTEAAIKRADLSQYRVISFATHGLLAGQFKGVMEPALVFTPPAQGTELDDGLLTAGEVAQLKLNADWVVMSACNTAGPSGEPGADGLSGLAKAFFYAGGRSLLVSHWPVNSEATVALMTDVFSAYSENPTHGKAEALRLGMTLFMKSNKRTYFAHPAFWAPFVLVGEGGVNARR